MEEEKRPARPRRPKAAPPPEADTPLTPEPIPEPAAEPARPRAAAASEAVKQSGGRLIGALRAIPGAIRQGLIGSRPGVIRAMTARPYVVLVAVVLISVIVTLLIAPLFGGGGPDYGSMKKMLKDIKDSGRTDWSIRTAAQTIDGKTYRLTKVESDRACFESQPSLVWKQKGCVFYGQVTVVLTVDTQ